KLRGVDGRAVATAAMGITLVGLLPWAPQVATAGIPSAETVVAACLAGVVATALSSLGYYHLIATIGPTRATLSIYLAPGFAVIFGILFLHEPLHASIVAGLALIITGAWLANRTRHGGDPAKAAQRVVAPADSIGS